MLGYVMAYKPELKMREYEAYRSYYCGVCKAVGERFGQLPRLALSYDFAFLALLLGSLDREKEDVHMEHCMIHPVKKIPITRHNWAVDYAADMMVLLVYHNFLDDRQDEHPVRGALGAAALKGAAKKLSATYPDVAAVMEKSLNQLHQLELAKTPSVDQTGDTFAAIMGAVFASAVVRGHVDEGSARALEHLGRNLGRWIYLADALDDVAEDIKSGSYNPLIYRFEYQAGVETPDEFKIRILSQMEGVLMSCLGEVGMSFNLLDVRKNKGILENILFLGLSRKSDDLLGKNLEVRDKEKENEGSI